MADKLLSDAIAYRNNFESELSTFPTKMARIVQQATPAAGQSFTLASLTGVGVIKMLQFTLGRDGDAGYNDVLEIYVDGETTPSFSVDVGTLLLTHLGGHATAQAYSTKHMIAVPYGAAQSNAMSGGIFFPVPYSNGCIVKLRAPTGGTSTGAGYVFGQIAYCPGQTSKWRLRSAAVPWLSKQTYSKSDQIVFADIPNVKGVIAAHHIAVQGNGGMQYLERCQWISVDAECGNETFDGFGIAQTGYTSSGGEDLFLAGWYFSGLKSLSGNGFSAASISNNGTYDTVAAVDFLAMHGGIPFNNRFRFGWSLKDPQYLVVGHSQAWCILYYVDTSAPFVATAPQNVQANTGATTAAVSWQAPASSGSSFITGYTVTLSPGGATQTVAANVLSANFTGLTTGQAYTASVVANTSIGTSAASTVGFTPSAVSSSWDFTTAALPSGVTATGGTNGTRMGSTGLVEAKAAPRFNYASGACQGILNEASATSLLLRTSELGTNPPWAPYSAAGGSSPTVTADTTVSPDGTQNAETVAFPAWTAATNSSTVSTLVQTVATTAGNTITSDVWLKGAAGGEIVYLYGQNNNGTYATLGWTKCTLTTAWQKFSLTVQATSASTNFAIGQKGDITGNATVPAQTVYAWGFEAKVEAVLSSYIAASASVVTRAADVISGTVPANCTAATINFADGTSAAKITGLTAGSSWTMPAQTKVVASVAFSAS